MFGKFHDGSISKRVAILHRVTGWWRKKVARGAVGLRKKGKTCKEIAVVGRVRHAFTTVYLPAVKLLFNMVDSSFSVLLLTITWSMFLVL